MNKKEVMEYIDNEMVCANDCKAKNLPIYDKKECTCYKSKVLEYLESNLKNDCMEYGWLIEIPEAKQPYLSHTLPDGFCGMCYYYTSNPELAFRFATREEAEVFLASNPIFGAIITEHGFDYERKYNGQQ